MQKISFISNMETIIRQSYIDKIEKYLGKETVIVSSDWAHSGECKLNCVKLQ